MPFISMVVGGVEIFLSLMLLLLVPTLSLPFDEEADDVATALNGRFLLAVLNIISKNPLRSSPAHQTSNIRSIFGYRLVACRPWSIGSRYHEKPWPFDITPDNIGV